MSSDIDRVTLYEEYRLIEKTDPEINGAWKGAHLLLFFLSFVFGSFCTFCFHVLMYLFDDKCVLFPKLLSIRDLRRSSSTSGIILDFIAHKDVDAMPVDFVTTQWVDKSVCYLPTYVPLVSGICGLVWTTMFLMCSSGSRTLTGLQRPWRILPSVFIFSLAMAGLCIYTSIVTQYGLQELCTKLGEITGSSTCTYTINVATLAYERRIRGVYQATRLTMLSAWLHTCCWVGAAALALARVILVVDFRLVRIRAELRGNVEKMLERHEKHIRTDEFWIKEDYITTNEEPSSTNESVKVRFVNKGFGTDTELKISPSTETLHYFSQKENYSSQLSLLPEERRRLVVKTATKEIKKEHRFLVRLLYDLVDSISLTSTSLIARSSSTLFSSDTAIVKRQYGKQKLHDSTSPDTSSSTSPPFQGKVENKEVEEASTSLAFRQQLELKLQQLPVSAIGTKDKPSTITPNTLTPYESFLNITPELQLAIDKAKERKSNLKNRGTQTNDTERKTVPQKVQITSPVSLSNASLRTLKGETDTSEIISTDSNATIAVIQDVSHQPSRASERKVSIAKHVTVLQEPVLKPVHEEFKFATIDSMKLEHEKIRPLFTQTGIDIKRKASSLEDVSIKLEPVKESVSSQSVRADISEKPTDAKDVQEKKIVPEKAKQVDIQDGQIGKPIDAKTKDIYITNQGEKKLASKDESPKEKQIKEQVLSQEKDIIVKEGQATVPKRDTETKSFESIKIELIDKKNQDLQEQSKTFGHSVGGPSGKMESDIRGGYAQVEKKRSAHTDDIEIQIEQAPKVTSSQLRQRLDEGTQSQTSRRNVDKETQRPKKEKQD